MLEISKTKAAQLNKPFWTRFWGQRRKCHPAFCPTVLGNGDHFVAITPLATRPNYYLTRIDSRWPLDNSEEDCLAEHLDEIYDALGDYFGPAEFENDHGRMVHDPWPACEYGCGQCWSSAMDLLGLEEIEYRGWEGQRVA